MKARRRAVTGPARAVRGSRPKPAAEPRPPTPARKPSVVAARPAAASRPVPVEVPAADVDLSVDLGRGLVLPNPILVASGTFGYGVEYGDVVDVNRLGAICCKGTTLKPRIGNPHAARDRDAGRHAQLDRAPEPGRGCGRSRSTPRLGRRWRVPVIVNVAGESVARLRRGRSAARRRARASPASSSTSAAPTSARAASSSRSTPAPPARSPPPSDGPRTCRCWSSCRRTSPTSGRSPGRSPTPAPTR